MNRSLRKLLANARFVGLRYEAIGHPTTNAPFPPSPVSSHAIFDANVCTSEQICAARRSNLLIAGEVSA